MIELQDVSLRYPGSTGDVLHQVSLTVPPGQLTALVGPNGSGKSTVVRALLGTLVPRSGRVLIGEQGVSAQRNVERSRLLAVVGQQEVPAFPMPVTDYVAMGRHPWRSAWGGLSVADHEAIANAMRDAEVELLATRRSDTLSGGEWQRVRLARALAQDAPVLVLDEPTAALDIAHEMAVFELLARLAATGRTVLVVSHQLNLVIRFAERVGILDHGRLVAFGRPNEVMQGPLLERVYRWPLVISRDPAVGAPTLVPLRRS